jgi:hypothetical protein
MNNEMASPTDRRLSFFLLIQSCIFEPENERDVFRCRPVVAVDGWCKYFAARQCGVDVETWNRLRDGTDIRSWASDWKDMHLVNFSSTSHLIPTNDTGHRRTIDI